MASNQINQKFNQNKQNIQVGHLEKIVIVVCFIICKHDWHLLS